MTSRRSMSYATGRRTTAWTTESMAVLTPRPRASVRVATARMDFWRVNPRMASRMERPVLPIIVRGPQSERAKRAKEILRELIKGSAGISRAEPLISSIPDSRRPAHDHRQQRSLVHAIDLQQIAQPIVVKPADQAGPEVHRGRHQAEVLCSFACFHEDHPVPAVQILARGATKGGGHDNGQRGLVDVDALPAPNILERRKAFERLDQGQVAGLHSG